MAGHGATGIGPKPRQGRWGKHLEAAQRRVRILEMAAARYDEHTMAAVLGISRKSVRKHLLFEAQRCQYIRGLSRQQWLDWEAQEHRDLVNALRPYAHGYVDDHQRPNNIPCIECGTPIGKVCSMECPTRVVKPSAPHAFAIIAALDKLRGLLGLGDIPQEETYAGVKYIAAWPTAPPAVHPVNGASSTEVEVLPPETTGNGRAA